MIQTTSHLGREFLRGVTKYVCETPDWDMRLIAGREDDWPIDEIATENFDGVISDSKNIPYDIVKREIPVIHIWPSSNDASFESMHRIVANESSVGKLALQYFIERGFKNFAFAGGLQYGEWANLREKAFVNAVRGTGRECYVYHRGRRPPRVYAHALSDEESMRRWLKRLPKPVALFAAYDRRGLQIIRSCRSENISIPDEIAVLGMDNDPVLCESIMPQLSSIKQSTGKAGYCAARELNRLMREKSVCGAKTTECVPVVITTGVECIVTRRSTDIYLPSGNSIVARAMSYINNEQSPVQSVKELSSLMRIPERSLRRYFIAYLGRGMHDVIAAARIERAKRMLIETNKTVREIAVLCGFANTGHFDDSFEKAVGLTPGVWRVT